MNEPVWKGWTDEAHEILVRETANGLSASQIGRMLGCSRNACIGRRHRHGIKSVIPAWDPLTRMAPPVPYVRSRSENATMQAVIRRTFNAKPGRPPKAHTTAMPANQTWPAKILADMNPGECKMPRPGKPPPIGYGDEILYCAAPIPTDERYCPACRKVMFKRTLSAAELAKATENAAKARAAKAMKRRAA